jgi:hypothetical protein
MLADIKLSDIKVSFGANDPPRDDKLISLLKQAYAGQLLCHQAIITWDAIKPFSDFRPKIDEVFKKYFFSQLKQNNYPPLYVYQESDKFIMSDNFSSYYLYQELKYEYVKCLVLGNPTGACVLYKGEPFKLPAPTIMAIEE